MTDPSPIETLLAYVLDNHRLREGPVPIGSRCTCGWRPYGLDELAHRRHLAARLADVLRGDALVETVAEALFAHEYGGYDPTAHPDHNRWTWHGDGHSDDHKQHFRQQARTAIDAIYGKETQ